MFGSLEKKWYQLVPSWFQLVPAGTNWYQQLSAGTSWNQLVTARVYLWKVSEMLLGSLIQNLFGPKGISNKDADSPNGSPESFAFMPKSVLRHSS